MSYVSQHNRFVREGCIGRVLHCSCFIPRERAIYSYWIGGGRSYGVRITRARTVRDQCRLQRMTAVVRISAANSYIQRTLGFWDVTLHHLVNSVSGGPRRIILRCDTASFGEQCFRWTKKNYSTYTGPQSTRAMHSFAFLAATNLMTHHTPQWWHPQLHCCETQRDLYVMFITFPVLIKAAIVCSYRHRLPAEKT